MKLEDNDQTRITKFINRIPPTNTKLHQQDPQHPKKCPSCNEQETNDHVSACNNLDRVKLRKNMIKTVRKTMEKTNTNIKAQEIIIQGLTEAVLHGTDQLDTSKISFEPQGILNQALQDQNAIGWTNFYKGRISKKWEQVQISHYQRIKAKRQTRINGQHRPSPPCGKDSCRCGKVGTTTNTDETPTNKPRKKERSSSKNLRGCIDCLKIDQQVGQKADGVAVLRYCKQYMVGPRSNDRTRGSAYYRGRC
jgi:hypothetical protein